MANAITKSIELEDGRVISIETGKLAKQADGSVVVRCGNTMLLATVVSDPEPMEGVDFFPLMVEYKEKFSAAGKFPGGFYKREARPSNDEILVCRIVDRALRPLFPDGYRNNTQVIIQLISADEGDMPDCLAGLAASACIAVSDIPFNGPISEVRVARIDGKFVINPGRADLAKADLDMIIAASATDVIMVEGEMKEVSEEEMLEAIDVAHVAIKKQIKLQLDLAAEIEKSKVKREVIVEEVDEELLATVKKGLYQKYYDLAKSAIADKHERSGEFKKISKAYLETFDEETLAEKGALIKAYSKKVEKEAIRNLLLDEKVRLDGRGTKDIRNIEIEIGLLPGPHGSSLFTRGETQSLTTVTLGTKLDEQTIDGVTTSGSEKFMLHYNFPPFSTKEARFLRATSRREIGHGNLALRALTPVLPEDKTINPYTIRVVSDILESNGSSSMATVCAGSLALMDAGVKISKPVSGIAMGLISDSTRNVVLSDILGDEDHLGDMDFKVTGTKDGITACQMDIKIGGLSFETLKEALLQAREGRLHILNEMSKVIDIPRDDYKPHAPRIISFEIPKEMIGAVIGPGGKVIQEIQAETGAVIVLEEIDNVGHVNICSNDQTSMEEANKRVRRIAFPPVVEVGTEYEGKVKSVVPYGAFVEIIPGTDGLLHVSELEWRKVDKVEDVLKEGEVVKFKVVGVDPRNGKYKLSRKVLLPKPEVSKN